MSFSSASRNRRPVLFLSVIAMLLFARGAAPVSANADGNVVPQLPAVSTGSADAVDVVDRPRLIFGGRQPTTIARRSVRIHGGETLDVTIEPRAGGFLLQVDSPSAAPLRIDSGEELQATYDGESNSETPFLLLVSKRPDGTQTVVLARRRAGVWDVQSLAHATPAAEVRVTGAVVVVAEPADQGERDLLYDVSSPAPTEPAMTWVPRKTLSVQATATNDAGIHGPEDAALHVTSFNEGTLTPWDSPNQPFDGVSGFEYGRTSANSDGALLSFGILQWNIWSGTLPPLLREFEQLDSTAFWSVFNGLDVTAFKSAVMSSTSTTGQAYEWARTHVPGGAWLTYTGRVPCSGYGADCRWIGGTMESSWTTAFSKLGAVAAFQAAERQAAIDGYISPIETSQFQTLNSATGRSWSLRALLVLVDLANQYGVNYANNNTCSLSAWVANSTSCSRNTGGSTGYSSALSDQANVKQLVTFLEPAT